MIFNVCKTCEHGGLRDGRSHCGKEMVYSHLTCCIGKKALEFFIEHDVKTRESANDFSV